MVMINDDDDNNNNNNISDIVTSQESIISQFTMSDNITAKPNLQGTLNVNT